MTWFFYNHSVRSLHQDINNNSGNCNYNFLGNNNLEFLLTQMFFA